MSTKTKIDYRPLLKKFQEIQAAFAKDNDRGDSKAGKIFSTINVKDFPPDIKYPLSIGILVDRKGAMFYLDHDFGSSYGIEMVDDTCVALEKYIDGFTYEKGEWVKK